MNGVKKDAILRYVNQTQKIDIEEIKRLLIENGADVNYQIDYDSTEGHNRAPYEDKICYNTTSLIIACEKKDPEAVRFLLQLGADIDTEKKTNSNIRHGTSRTESSNSKTNPFIIACHNNDLNTLKYLLYYSNKKINDIEEYHQSIQYHFGNSNTDYNSKYNSLLSIACQHKNIEMVKLLLEHGANPDIKFDYKTTVIDMVKSFQEDDINKKILQLLTNPPPLVFNNDAKSKTISKYDVNSIEIKNVFFEACDTGNIRVVNKYIALGGDIHVRDESGNTALMRATKNEHFHLFKQLLKTGIDINAKNNNGETVLFKALSNLGNKCKEIIKLFIELGGNVNAKDKWGKTALWNAGIVDFPDEVIESLIKAGLNINERDNDGETALIWSCKKEPDDSTCGSNEDGDEWIMHHDESDINMLSQLLRFNADTNIQDKKGKTVCSYVEDRMITEGYRTAR